MVLLNFVSIDYEIEDKMNIYFGSISYIFLVVHHYYNMLAQLNSQILPVTAAQKYLRVFELIIAILKGESKFSS